MDHPSELPHTAPIGTTESATARAHTPVRLAFFILVRALPAWLRETRAQRQIIWRRDVQPCFDADPAVSMRYFDAEIFTARCSDLLLVEADDIDAYNNLMEGLRDSPLFAHPYFELIDIIASVEEGYRRYETHLASRGV